MASLSIIERSIVKGKRLIRYNPTAEQWYDIENIDGVTFEGVQLVVYNPTAFATTLTIANSGGATLFTQSCPSNTITREIKEVDILYNLYAGGYKYKISSSISSTKYIVIYVLYSLQSYLEDYILKNISSLIGSSFSSIVKQNQDGSYDWSKMFPFESIGQQTFYLTEEMKIFLSNWYSNQIG